MCQDRLVESPQVSRRRVLKGAAYLSLSAAAVGRLAWAPPASAATIAGAYSMAMHIHSSFSELSASMDAQLFQAQDHGVDVIWWTDHDTKMNGMQAKHVVHFTSLTAETGDGTPWKLTQTKTGLHTSASTGGIVSTPASPMDTVPDGSLQVAAQSTGTAKALFGFQTANIPSGQNWRTNLADQTLAIEVLPTSIGNKAYLELYILTSFHPATGGRTAGKYSLSYRIGGAASPGSRTRTDRQAIVTLPATTGQWNSYVLRPDQDLAALYPDLDSRDFSLYTLRFGAVSASNAVARGNFDYLRFTRPNSGELNLQVQDSIMAAAASRYPNVAQRHGLEVSHYLPHINWFGGNVSLPTYAGMRKPSYSEYIRSTIIPDIHSRGGLASYNHPYGTSFGPMKDQATQDQLLSQVATQILPNKACGADIIEVGYPMREGVDIAHHVGLWDVMSRNGVFLTGNGVSDDHSGNDWLNPPNVTTWTTSAWAPDKSEASLLQGLRAGKVWCQSLIGYAGAMDVLVDGTCPMGSISVSQATSRSLLLTATSVPAGGDVRVVQGAVDYAGTASPTPNTQVVAIIPAGDLMAGQARITMNTSSSSFVRTEVRNSAGTVVGLSNPVWLLRSSPPGGIPLARQA